MPPPLLRPEQISKSVRAWSRSIGLARASAVTLIVLAGLSTVVNVLHPLTPHFLVSVAALVNGVLEWRFAGRLAKRDPRAPRWLAINQLALGGEILIYSLWRAATLMPADILAVLDRPEVRSLLEAMPREEINLLREMLPPLLRAMYLIVGIVAVIGCAGMALYYRTRQRHLAQANMVLQP